MMNGSGDSASSWGGGGGSGGEMTDGVVVVRVVVSVDGWMGLIDGCC